MDKYVVRVKDSTDLPSDHHLLGSSYVSCIDFDSKGIYLASVSNKGGLSIHEYETLYCRTAKRSDGECPFLFNCCWHEVPKASAVRWNPANQEEVACVGAGNHTVCIYNIAQALSLPSETLTVKGNHNVEGLRDLSICKHGSSRFLACGKDGNVHIWDRRASTSSYAALPVPDVAGALNCLQLSNDEQVVYAGSEGGFIHAWDLRGGKRAAAFVTSREVYHEPVGAVKLATVLSNISDLREQTEIGVSEVLAISLDSACGHRLAFHLYNGWSGVYDMATMDVTHIHCPPPPCWHDVDQVRSNPGVATVRVYPCERRPVWISSYSVFAVGSAIEPQIYMLDFTVGSKSRCSIQYDHFNKDRNEEERQTNVPTSDAVVSVATHPLNDQLVVGTQGGQLLLLGQAKSSTKQKDISNDHGE